VSLLAETTPADRWSVLVPFPRVQGSAAVAGVDGKIHLFDGCTSTDVVTMAAENRNPAF
jgi:hypothetical protein